MDYDKCLSRLQRLCSKAEYCRSQMYTKALRDLEGDADAAKRVVDSLVADRYVDDARYASAFAREKASIQGWGPVKIRFQLRSKGISDADIASGMSEIEEPKAARKLESVLAAKYRTLQGDPQCKLKLLKFALSRGYEYQEVSSILDLIIKNNH
ncbi:MAG: RecX family transcriptional regulator [Bacteroidales bacterium]|nr:RecX family transcriptional regulator [Bacteroidales bacterium]